MPWTVSNVERFNKNLSPKQKAQWVAVANSTRKKCMDDGGSEKDCDAKAIQMANGVVKTHGGSGSGWHGPPKGDHVGEGSSEGGIGEVGATSRFENLDQWQASLSKEQKSAVDDWMYRSYDEMRDLDKSGQSSEKLDNFKEALKTAPLYQSGLYRGIRADLKLKQGDYFSLSAISSFSTNRAVGKSFAVTTPEGKPIPTSRKFTVLAIENHEGAPRIPVKSVGGTYETEAVFLKGTKFRVSKIEPLTIKRPGKVYKGKIVYLEGVRDE